MKSYLTAEDVVGEIILSRQIHKGAFVIFEGSSDAKLFERFLRASCDPVVGHTRENVVNAVVDLNSRKIEGIIGIVDADFWIHDQATPQINNLCLTDFHDVEVMIINSPTLSKILKEFGSEEKISSHFGLTGKDVRGSLFEIGKHIGSLRYISKQDELFLCFDDICLGDYADLSNLHVNIPNMVRAIKNKSQKHGLNDVNVCTKITNALSKPFSVEQICCGHDLVEVLSHGLRKVWGTNNSNEVLPNFLEKILRIGYEAVYFSQTRLYNSILNWERTNRPYRILNM